MYIITPCHNASAATSTGSSSWDQNTRELKQNQVGDRYVVHTIWSHSIVGKGKPVKEKLLAELIRCLLKNHDTYWWCLFLYKKYLEELLAPGTDGLIRKKNHTRRKHFACIGRIGNLVHRLASRYKTWKSNVCTKCGVDGREMRQG